MPLVLTSSGIEECPTIDREQLDALATWLCNEECYHDKVDAWAGCKVTDAAYTAFERECCENGGYCNCCRDFAAEMLSRFQVERRYR